MGPELQKRHNLLLGISLLLALHNFAVSRYLASVLLVMISLCWLWVGVSAIRSRLDDAKAMSITIFALLAVSAICARFLFPATQNQTAFLLLALLPTLVACACTFVYISFLQTAGEAGSIDIDAWFEEWGTTVPIDEGPSRVTAEHFSEAMLSSVPNDNARSPGGSVKRRRRGMNVAN